MIKAKGKNVFELRKAGILEYLVTEITVSFFASAEVAAGECLAFCIPEFRDKVFIQVVDGRNGSSSSRILDYGRVFCIAAVHESQESSGAEEYAANGFARIDGTVISGGGPLHGYRLKSFGLPQNLQDSFRSGVPFHHHNDAFIPQFFHPIIVHGALPYPYPIYCSLLRGILNAHPAQLNSSPLQQLALSFYQTESDRIDTNPMPSHFRNMALV
jgi:hypothetical protein